MKDTNKNDLLNYGKRYLKVEGEKNISFEAISDFSLIPIEEYTNIWGKNFDLYCFDLVIYLNNELINFINDNIDEKNYLVSFCNCFVFFVYVDSNIYKFLLNHDIINISKLLKDKKKDIADCYKIEYKKIDSFLERVLCYIFGLSLELAFNIIQLEDYEIEDKIKSFIQDMVIAYKK